MRKALLPGTFDPPTLGHLDIIQRAAKLFDELFVGIADNTVKSRNVFSTAERKALLLKLCAPYQNVKIVTFNGLVVDYAQKKGIDCLVRGVRSVADFEYESQMASANHMMSGIETIFLAASSEYVHFSSTLIREIGTLRHRLHGFVPSEIEEEVFLRLSQR